MDINKDVLLAETLTEAQKVSELKSAKNVIVPPIEKIMAEYDPFRHDVYDKTKRKDKKVQYKEDVNDDGIIKTKTRTRTEPVARIHLALQQLVVRRMTEFLFAIPVERIYHGVEKSETHKQVVDAIKAIYTRNHIDSENINRARQLLAGCEIAVLWYTQERQNEEYGFPCSKRLRCKTYSPMDGYSLYPYFDEYGDLIAMSVEYFVWKYEDKKKQKIVYFDTYTAEYHYRWKTHDGKVTCEVDEKNNLGKIPYIYACRPYPIWEHTTAIINEIEMTLSRNSDVIAYNSAPILVVKGDIIGNEAKGEERRAYQVENGGDVSYVSWSQSNESVRYHVDMLLKLFWQQLQLPDISLENLRGLQASGEAMKTLLTDAHLKVGDESGVFIEFFEREASIIKAMLKALNPSWSKAIDEIQIEHKITPYIQNDESAKLNRILSANGGKPVISQRQSIEMADYSHNADATMEEIANEEAQREQSRIANMFEGAM